MTILNVNYRQFEEYHFVFAQMNAAMLHWWAKQNNYFIVYISFLVLVTNAVRIHLTKNKKNAS